jgi:hypothetical protein
LIVNRYVEFHFNAYHNYWEIVFLAHSKSKRGNNSNKMLDRVVFSCQHIGVNTFYKRIEFQVNSFDSYWEILIMLKKNIPNFYVQMYYVETRADNSGYTNHRIICLVVITGTWPMDLNFPVCATGLRIFRASNDVGPLFLGPGSTRMLEINTR